MESQKHSHQRVAVFIDVQNMYYSARALYGSKVNFGEIVKAAVGSRELIRATAYTIRAEVPEEEDFFRALEARGIEVKSKDLQVFVDGRRKGDWDVGIAVDIMRMAPKVDVIVLVSGDGDFQMVLEYARSSGCRIEVVSFMRSTSRALAEQADSFINLEDDTKRFLMAGRGRRIAHPRAQAQAAQAAAAAVEETAEPKPKAEEAPAKAQKSDTIGKK